MTEPLERAVRWPLARAVRWIDAHLVDLWVPGALPGSIKAAGELAHTADRLREVEDFTATADAWLVKLWSWFEGGELHRRLIAADAAFAPVALTFLPFHLLGRDNPALRATLVECAPRLVLRPFEWTIVASALELFGVDPGASGRALARAGSVLAREPDPRVIPVDAMYLLAHECLYATGWGRYAPIASSAAHAYLEAAVPVLLARCTELADPDVLAEIILTARVVGLADRVDARAWQVLADAQAPDGHVRPVARSQMVLPRTEHPRFGRAFHTTVAAVMAWAGAGAS
jgi:hypothetical protein